MRGCVCGDLYIPACIIVVFEACLVIGACSELFKLVFYLRKLPVSKKKEKKKFHHKMEKAHRESVDWSFIV